MAEQVYEGMYILDSNRFGRDSERLSTQLSESITKAGGEVLVSRLWEERRLAYPIKGHRKGTYWLTYFRLDSGKLSDLQRECQLNDGIIRQLFLKVDPRIVDALVEHARTGQARPSQAEAIDAPKDGDNSGQNEKQETVAKAE